MKNFAIAKILPSAVIGLSICATLPLCADSGQTTSILSKISPSIVTVKVVLKEEAKAGGQSHEEETRAELHGVAVTADGLIMVSNTTFSAERLAELVGAPSDGDLGFKLIPTDFKVVFQDEEKEYPAYLAASDSTLGVAFIKVEDLAGKSVVPVDFSGTAAPSIGDELSEVSRLNKGYDYAPTLRTSHVSAEIDKPRKAWVLDGSAHEQGLPVLDAQGDTVGILTYVPSGVSASAAGGADMGAFMGMMGGSARAISFVVPNSALTPIILQAEAQAKNVAATRATTPPDPKLPAPIKKQ